MWLLDCGKKVQCTPANWRREDQRHRTQAVNTDAYMSRARGLPPKYNNTKTL